MLFQLSLGSYFFSTILVPVSLIFLPCSPVSLNQPFPSTPPASTRRHHKVSIGPWNRAAPRVPSPGWRQNALCLQYAWFPLDKAWKPLCISEHPIGREMSRCSLLLQLKSQQADKAWWTSRYRTHGTSVTWELHHSQQHKAKLSSDITSTPTPTMQISSFICDLCKWHSAMVKCSALKRVSAASLPLLIKIFNALVRRRNLITELLSNKSWKQFKVNFPNMSIFLSCQKGC